MSEPTYFDDVEYMRCNQCGTEFVDDGVGECPECSSPDIEPIYCDE